MTYKLKGELKDLINRRAVRYEVEDYKEKGIIFVCEDGQITRIGRETKDADRK